MAKKNNTQLICLTGLNGRSIYSQFDNIYSLGFVSSSLNGKLHLKGKHEVGSDPQIMSTARLQVMKDGEQLQLIF